MSGSGPTETMGPAAPAPPSSVSNAVMLMYLNIAIGLVVGLVDGALASDSGIGAVAGVALAVWLARRCRDGRRWARLVYTILSGLGVIVAPADVVLSGAVLLKIVSVAGALISLAAITLLWRGESRSYFAKARPVDGDGERSLGTSETES